MGIERLGQVIYTVRDMDPCVVFYRDVLGLEVKFRDGDRWAAFNAGGVTFALAAASEVTSGGDGKIVPSGVAAFRVSDLPAFASGVAERSKGGAVEVREGAHELRLELQDPSGNTVMFYEPLARPG